MAICSFQLDQATYSFLSRHQHGHWATILAHSQESSHVTFWVVPHILKFSILAALLLLQEHFPVFCPFFPSAFHAKWVSHLPWLF